MRGTFTRGDDVAFLALPSLELPPALDLFGETWRVKPEFHVTLLGTEALRRAGNEEADRAARGLEFDVRLGQDFYRLDEGDARTLIVLCEVENGDSFFSRLGWREQPPYHVTLYTIGTEIGIGLASHDDLARLGTPIRGAERDILLKALYE